jgi:mono/diheme cytochrome c family protein
VKISLLSMVFSMLVISSAASAGGDTEAGKRDAQFRCATCHAVVPSQRDEIANPPPFTLIAQKFKADPDMLLYTILDPHPRMNVRLNRREAEDVAAYILSLAK